MTRAEMQDQGPRTVADWVAAIAQRAGVDVKVAQAVLDKRGVVAQPTLPRARTLCIRSVLLEGVKEGTPADGPFQFSWSGLRPGLWALMSDKNSRGKSSILNILRSALRGDFPGRLKADVWKWLSRIQVCFGVDGVNFRVLVEKTAGEQSVQAARVRLSRDQGIAWIDLYDGPPGDGLEAQTAAVFMEELGFAKFHAFNAKTETGHSHGWPAMSSALFISGPGKAIFGDLTTDAMPLRLLQLFMGLPWVSTLTAAQTAAKQVEAERRQRSTGHEQASERLRSRLSSVEQELSAAQFQLAHRPDRDALRRNLASQDLLLAKLQTEASDARTRLEELNALLVNATNSHVEAKRTLQQAKDEQAAGYLFRRLRPVCCPACEAGIDNRRYEAVNVGSCALCGNPEPVEVDENADRVVGLTGDVADTEATVLRLKAEVASAEHKVREVDERRQEIGLAIDALKRQLAEDGGATLELTIAALEARSAELRSLLSGEPEPSSETVNMDLSILKAAEEITKQMFDDLQRDLLRDVSAAITRFSQVFGVENVADMELNSGGVLRVRQGGSETSFTKLADGERLRVRIAAALAVVEVAQARGYGRHPGLLVLDSPASQEMTEEDFAALLASVQDTVKQTEGIQIIVGAVARPVLSKVVAVEQRIHAHGEASLF